MSIRKYQCECCGVALMVMPGMRRITCPHCGTVYEVQGENASAPVQGGPSRDNPVDVRLVPMGGGPIFLGPLCGSAFSANRVPPERVRGRGVTPDFTGEQRAEAEENLARKMTFFAALSLLEGREIPLYGRAIPDITLRFLPHADAKRLEELRKPGIGFNAEEIRRLEEPKAVYWHRQVRLGGGTLDSLNGQNLVKSDENITYDRAQNARDGKARRAFVQKLLAPYGFETAEQKRLTDPDAELYYREGFLVNSDKLHSRIWTTEYTVMTFRTTMTPQRARTLLGPEKLDMLQKLGQHAVLDQLAADMAKMLNMGYEYLLRIRESKPVWLIVEKGGIGLGKVIEKSTCTWPDYYARGTALEMSHGRASDWRFREFGMGNLPDVQAQVLLAAQVMSRLLPLTREGGLPRWNLTGMGVEKGMDDPLTAVQLYPAARAEAVYKSWI